MVKGHLKKHADLTLLVGIRAIADNKANKLNGLLKRAADRASREQKSIDRPSMSDAIAIKNMYQELCNNTKWNKKPMHPLTFVNFCLEILENHNMPKIVEALEDITEHFEKGNKAPTACFWAGTVAFEKWAKITDGC